MQRMKVDFYNMTPGTPRVVDSRSVNVKHQGGGLNGGIKEAAEAKALVTAWATAKGWTIQIICVLWADSSPTIKKETSA